MPGPRFNFTNEKHTFSETWSKLIRYCRKYIAPFAFAIIFAILGTVFTIIGPDKLREMTNAITSGMMTGIDLNLVYHIGMTLVTFYVSSVVLSYVQSFIMATITQNVCKNLRSDIALKINRLPLKYFDTSSTGDTLSRVTNDVDTIGQTLNQSLVSLISSIVLFLGALLMMFITNYILAFVAVGASLIGFIFMIAIISRSQKYFVKQQQLLGKINGHIEEVYSGHNIIKVYNAENRFHEKFATINNDLRKDSKIAQFMSGLMMPLMNFIGNFGYLTVCVAGALLLIDGRIAEIGTIVAFIVYIRLFTQPLTTIAQSMSSLQTCSAASFRVFDFLEKAELPDESNKKAKIESAKGNIEFRNVRFAYDEGKVIIKNFSANIKQGQKIAIVGPTGAGKTTMVNLLMRFYDLKQPKLIINNEITDYDVFTNGKSIKIHINDDLSLTINDEKTNYTLDSDIAKKLPLNVDIKFDQDFNMNVDDSPLDYKIDVLVGDKIDAKEKSKFGIAYFGDIFIDGVPTKSNTRENIHDQFCMVLQDTWLFEGSIKENIAFNKTDVTNEEIISACKTANIYHFINTLPQKYDTILDEDANLSAGQKQLLTIARAMVSKAPILILDEATSSVDTRTEQLIQDAMDKLMKGRTSIVIAHRLSTIKSSDLILVMKDGDIIEKGNHTQLMEAKGFYADLYNSQFDKVD